MFCFCFNAIKKNASCTILLPFMDITNWMIVRDFFNISAFLLGLVRWLCYTNFIISQSKNCIQIYFAHFIHALDLHSQRNNITRHGSKLPLPKWAIILQCFFNVLRERVPIHQSFANRWCELILVASEFSKNISFAKIIYPWKSSHNFLASGLSAQFFRQF